MITPTGERKGDSPSGSAANALRRRGVSFLAFLLSCFYSARRVLVFGERSEPTCIKAQHTRNSHSPPNSNRFPNIK